MKTILRKDLYDKIWSETKSRTAKELGLPFQELTQICRIHNIPTPTSNYWIQLSLGKPVIKAPLPDPEQNPEISLATEKTLKNIKKQINRKIQMNIRKSWIRNLSRLRKRKNTRN